MRVSIALGKRKRIFLLAGFNLLILFFLVRLFVHADTQVAVYTGCLSSNGTLSKVAIGTSPTSACSGAQTQISWSTGDITSVSAGTGLSSVGPGQTGDLSLSIANSGVNTLQLADNAVTTPKLSDAAVTTLKLADASITTQKLALNSVTSPILADNAITNAKLGLSSVDTTNIVDLSVTGAKLADGSVSGAKLLDNIISTSKLIDGSVSTAKIADGAVGTSKLADGSITPDKISNDASESSRIQDWSDDTDTQVSAASGATQVIPTSVSVTVPSGKAYYYSVSYAGTMRYNFSERVGSNTSFYGEWRVGLQANDTQVGMYKYLVQTGYRQDWNALGGSSTWLTPYGTTWFIRLTGGTYTLKILITGYSDNTMNIARFSSHRFEVIRM